MTKHHHEKVPKAGQATHNLTCFFFLLSFFRSLHLEQSCILFRIFLSARKMLLNYFFFSSRRVFIVVSVHLFVSRFFGSCSRFVWQLSLCKTLLFKWDQSCLLTIFNSFLFRCAPAGQVNGKEMQSVWFRWKKKKSKRFAGHLIGIERYVWLNAVQQRLMRFHHSQMVFFRIFFSGFWLGSIEFFFLHLSFRSIIGIFYIWC